MIKGISDDLDFCFKLAKEESVIILPGTIFLRSEAIYSVAFRVRVLLYKKDTKFTEQLD